MKLFGMDLFKKRKEVVIADIFGNANNRLKNEDYLPDFYRGRGNMSIYDDSLIRNYVVTEEELSSVAKKVEKEKKKRGRPSTTIEITPKGIYEFKLLNAEGFKVNTDPAYIENQIASFKDRLKLVKSSYDDMENGVIELSSILIRMENRKLYENFNGFYSEYAYTTNENISKVIKSHNNIQIGKVDQFVAELPQDAIDAMKNYTEKTIELCKKKPLFYIIADKKDFKKTETRKDPILLAQSPFGHFWQILGAWDKEMILLDEL